MIFAQRIYESRHVYLNFFKVYETHAVDRSGDDRWATPKDVPYKFNTFRLELS